MEHPSHCPEGHELGPGTASITWNMNLKRHHLYCVTCNYRTRLPQVDGAEWEVLVSGRWVKIG